MTTTATLAEARVRLEPGSEVVVDLEVRNEGTTVEGYRFEVVGAPAAWTEVDPPELSLYPGTEGTATVTFKPPRSAAVPAGEQQFAVIVTPTEHPDDTVVPEGVVEVLPFLDTVAELVPRTSQGRFSGRHQVALDNRSNVPVTALLEGVDESRKLKFRLDPPRPTVPPGEAHFAKLAVKPVKTVWWGQPLTFPFSVVVTPEDSTSVALDGTHVQQPVIPRWLPKLLALLLALLLLLLALWFLLLKPVITSAAKEAAEEAVAESVEVAEEAAEEAAAAGETAQESAGAAQKSAGDAQKASDKANKLVGEKLNRRTVVTAITERLSVETASTADSVYEVPERSTFEVTDMVLSNPQGDFGRVMILLDGDIAFDVALENFRDLDYHFVSPLTVTDGQTITLSVRCNAPGQPPDADPPSTCDVAALLGGQLTSPRPKRN